MTDLEYLESKIRENQKEAASLRKKESLDNAARELKRLYDSFVSAGFTEEQSWELFMNCLNNLL